MIILTAFPDYKNIIKNYKIIAKKIQEKIKNLKT
jgi:hypothetical protein